MMSRTGFLRGPRGGRTRPSGTCAAARRREPEQPGAAGDRRRSWRRGVPDRVRRRRRRAREAAGAARSRQTPNEVDLYSLCVLVLARAGGSARSAWRSRSIAGWQIDPLSSEPAERTGPPARPSSNATTRRSRPSRGSANCAGPTPTARRAAMRAYERAGSTPTCSIGTRRQSKRIRRTTSCRRTRASPAHDGARRGGGALVASRGTPSTREVRIRGASRSSTPSRRATGNARSQLSRDVLRERRDNRRFVYGIAAIHYLTLMAKPASWTKHWRSSRRCRRAATGPVMPATGSELDSDPAGRQRDLRRAARDTGATQDQGRGPARDAGARRPGSRPRARHRRCEPRGDRGGPERAGAVLVEIFRRPDDAPWEWRIGVLRDPLLADLTREPEVAAALADFQARMASEGEGYRRMVADGKIRYPDLREAVGTARYNGAHGETTHHPREPHASTKAAASGRADRPGVLQRRAPHLRAHAGSGRGAVVIVPMLDDDTVLLVREYAAGLHATSSACRRAGSSAARTCSKARTASSRKRSATARAGSACVRRCRSRRPT